MYKITNKQIVESNQALEGLKGVKFSGNVLMKLARVGAELKKEALLVESARAALIAKHSDNGELAPASPGYDAFVKEWKDLLNQETELNTKVKLKESELDLDRIGEQIPVTTMRDLLWLFD